MSIICKSCDMLTNPMGLYCEFCGHSPFFKTKNDVELKLKEIGSNNQKAKLQLEEILKTYK